MKELIENLSLRDFLKREKNQYDYEDKEGWIIIITIYLLIHIFLEGVYLYSYCTPMVYINLVSIAVYLFLYYLNATSHYIAKVWSGVIEIYFHVIFSTFFMGYDCGFYLWLFGMVIGVITPYFMPVFTKRQQIIIYLSALLFLSTFLILTSLNLHGLLPTSYNAADTIKVFLFYVNAILTFFIILLYSTLYSWSIKQNNERLRSLANTDYLTGLYNRQYIQKKLSNRIDEGKIKNISIAIMDVDYFKKINDTYGHLMGDYVLEELAKIISSKGFLHIGRWGGEEFMLISSSKSSYEDFCAIINELCSEISDHIFTYDNTDVKVTASFGSATLKSGMKTNDLIKEADSRLYYAKEHGRNVVISA